MSTDAELFLLKNRIAELESTVEIIDRGISRKERRLRDEFAMAAMAALLPDYWNEGTIARKAYEAADEMMRERGND